MRLSSLAAVLTLLALPAAHAADCSRADTQMELDACAAAAFKADDATLNQLYARIEARLGGDADKRKALVAAQRAWVAYRDAACKFAASGVEGGSIHPMIVTDCEDRLTKRRIQDFQAYLSCQEGDTACPVPQARADG
ncbi:lysozyme inhibitor LprI family protein [Acidocella sp.]|uniref:lysozyme inhibitor LprI family protein n=1 Tax=Acidocella sp. TaxID=50710 RepID=UPI003CFC861A